MSKSVAVIIWIAIFIFITPVCVMAGAFGGCLFGAVLTPMNENAMPIIMGVGGLVGLAAGIAIPIMVLRGIKNSQRRQQYDHRPY